MGRKVNSSWKYNFSSVILERGLKYYKAGKVHNMVVTSTEVDAIVDGTEQYCVQIKNPATAFPVMKCSCPYGRCCKHMAAVLYKWETEGSAENDNGTDHAHRNYNVIVRNPFDEKNLPEKIAETYKIAKKNGVKPYYDIPSMFKDIEVTRKTCDEAVEYVNSGNVRITDFNEGYLNGTYDRDKASQCMAMIEGKYHDDTEWYQIEIYIFRDEIEIANCQCGCSYPPSYYTRYVKTSFCSHLMAMMYLVYDYILKVNPGDDTNRQACAFLDELSQMRVNKMIEESKPRVSDIRLVPRLTNYDDVLELSFRIGTDKLYVLKNIHKLIGLVENNRSLELGKKSGINFMTDAFDDNAAQLFELIKANDSRRTSYNGRHSMFRDEYDNDSYESIALSGDMLDRFFDIMKNKTVELQHTEVGSRDVEVLLKDGSLTVKMSIRANTDSGRFDGIDVEGTLPSKLDGERYHYFINKHSFVRIGPKEYRSIAPFYSISEDGQFSMMIGNKRISDFYYRVLPQLYENPNVKIDNPDEAYIRQNMPANADITFYLDSENGILKCIGTADYNNSDSTSVDRKSKLDSGRAFDIRTIEYKELPIEAFRNADKEDQTADLIKEYFPNYNDVTHEYCCDRDDDQVFKILDTGISDLMSVGEVQCTDRFNRIRIRNMPQIQIGVSVSNDLMNLKVLSEGVSPDELADLLASYRSKKRYHRLKNGDFISIEGDNSIETFSDMLDNLKIPLKDMIRNNIKVPLYRALYLNKMLEDHDEIAQNRDSGFKSLIKEFKTVGDSDFEVPESLEGTMREYQKYGYKWIRTLAQFGFGGILADDMGLGKTLQVISVLLSEKEKISLTNLVVCPASLVYNWQEEFSKFAPSIRTQTVTGTLSERKEILEHAPEYDVLITSYDLLKRDAVYYEELKFRFLVIDEAQFIKNPKSGAAKSVKIINSSRRIALTGTPIENRLSELWSIFDFLMPGFLFSYEDFKKRFETPIARDGDKDATERLQKMVAPFILRRLKKNVLADLPEKTEENRYAKITGEQQKLYDAQVLHMQKMLKMSSDEFNKSRIQVLAELTKIRQICCDPSLITSSYTGESAKLEACIDLIKSAMDGGHRMLVFSQFTSMLAIIQKRLDDEKIRYFLITGATPKEERIKLVHEFNESEGQNDYNDEGGSTSAEDSLSEISANENDKKGVSVFLISLKAGGTGLNLTGADVVIHYDPWWNAAAQNQATDRAHRIGQTKEVSVYRLIVKGTIEEKIMKIQESKSDLADAILSGEQQSLGQLSKDELAELLG